MRIIRALLYTSILISCNLFACSDAQLLQELNRFSKPVSVGYSALIAENGHIRCKQASGLANLEHNVTMTPNHIFEIGSLTKQFTAVATLLLVQQDKLALNTPINQFYPNIKMPHGTITIEHLLSHTSGLVDPINSPEFLTTRLQESISLTDLMTQFQNGYWQHAPGERIIYSNVGYSMLADIIEKTSKTSYLEFLSKHIFKPANMTTTSQVSFSITKNKATGYTYQGDTPRQNDFINLQWAYGAADLISTTKDLARFNTQLMNKQLLNDVYLTKFLAPITLNNGTKTRGSYTYSLENYEQHDVITMSGSTFGYASHSMYFPEQKRYILVLANSDGINGGGWISPQTVAQSIAKQL